MAQFEKNPRKISDSQLAMLAECIKELGDLGGIVHDVNSDQIISGNPRAKVIDINSCKIELVKELKKPDKQGTLAWGFIHWDGTALGYRKVKWTPEQCKKANIAAKQSLSGMVGPGIGGPKSAYMGQFTTWEDKLRQNWNSERGPMNYFQGALQIAGKDENGDLIYRYEGLKRKHIETEWDVLKEHK